jgi:hypothetical protein
MPLKLFFEVNKFFHVIAKNSWAIVRELLREYTVLKLLQNLFCQKEAMQIFSFQCLLWSDLK